MADRTRGPLPVPPGVRDTTESDLDEIVDPNVRYRIRRLVAWAYAEGYADGHVHGAQEVYADRRVERDAARA